MDVRRKAAYVAAPILLVFSSGLQAAEPIATADLPAIVVRVDNVAGVRPVLLPFVDGGAAFAVRRAADGAAVRLALPACQEVLADFSSVSGEPLATILVTRGITPTEAFSRIRFADDSTAPQCRVGTTLAFTQPGSTVVRICGLQFRTHFDRDRRATEIILIHEFLHTIGLGENPPSSREITERAAARCAG